jgi:hypothetical protein
MPLGKRPTVKARPQADWSVADKNVCPAVVRDLGERLMGFVVFFRSEWFFYRILQATILL